MGSSYIYDPTLVAYFFFNAERDIEAPNSLVKLCFQRLSNGLPLLIEKSTYYLAGSGKAGEPQRYVWLFRLDNTWVVQLLVDQVGSCSVSTWEYLWTETQNRLGNVLLTSDPSTYLGTSLVFGAIVGFWQRLFSLAPLSASIPRLDKETESLLFSPQPWGKFFQVEGRSGKSAKQTMIYALFYSKRQERHAANFLHDDSTHPFAAQELSLHRCYHQIDEYLHHRQTLMDRIAELDEKLITLVDHIAQGNNKHRSRQRLEKIASQYASFVRLSSLVNELQQTIAINASNYRESCTASKLLRPKDGVFATHLHRFEQIQQQLDADSYYYDAAIQRVQTGVETLRTRLEFDMAQREGYRDLLLAMLGIILGLSQLVPIWQEMLKLAGYSANIRWQWDAGMLVGLVLVGFFLLLGWWFLGKRRQKR